MDKNQYINKFFLTFRLENWLKRQHFQNRLVTANKLDICITMVVLKQFNSNTQKHWTILLSLSEKLHHQDSMGQKLMCNLNKQRSLG